MRTLAVGVMILLANVATHSSLAQDKQPSKKNLATRIMDKVIDVKFSKKKYAFTLAEVAKGVKFKYQIVVRQDIPNVHPMSQRTANNNAGKSKLYAFEMISGNKQRYCIRDVGLGIPPQRVFRTIQKGKYKQSFTWDGRNWSGPSDFDNPKGKPFPPGTYKLTVSFVGQVKTDEGIQRYRVERSVAVILTQR
ncbi:MAG: hypothetical protein ACFCD0_03025 [Gemmataceae bacterium]